MFFTRKCESWPSIIEIVWKFAKLFISILAIIFQMINIEIDKLTPLFLENHSEKNIFWRVFIHKTVNHTKMAKHSIEIVGKLAKLFISIIVIIFQMIKIEIDKLTPSFLENHSKKKIFWCVFLHKTVNHTKMAKQNRNSWKIGKIVYFYHSLFQMI